MSQQPEVLNQVSNGAAVQLHTAPIATKDVFGSGTGEDGMEWFHS
jgi:hypothetical protein